MDLISIIAIIVIISKIIKKAGEASESVVGKSGNAWDNTVYQAPKKATRVDSPRSQVNQQNNQWQKATRENIEKARQLAAKKMQQLEAEVMNELHRDVKENEHFREADMHRQQENRQAMQQVHASRMEARNTTILQRAKANAEEDRIDVTLESMEAEHNHSERVSAAVHHHPEDVMPESMLGNIEDLMIKGYDGNLCFERDFVGEGMDLIARFSVPSDIPDYSSHYVA